MWGAAPYNRRVVLLLGLFAAIVLGCVQGAGAVLTPAGSSAAGAAPAQTTVDSQAPTSPSNLTVTAVTANSISLSWSTATDNVGVTGYGRYLIGQLVNSGTLTRFTWTGLKCGTNYALAVDATDAAGNRSAPASLTASTTSCGPDTTGPSSVGNLQLSSATQTTIALGWLPATDNVGVAGYNLYVNGTKVGSTTNTSYTFTGLACGTAYSLAIETFDAAGNVSNRSLTTTSQSTTPCDKPSTPTGPAVMVGNATIEAQADSSPAGEAEAGVTTAASTGQVNELRVYLDTPTTATSVKVGIYADAGGKPGARLSSGTIAAPQKGTWNAAPIAPVSVSAGKQYWIAVLGIGGAVAYRDRCCGSGTPVQTNAGVLTELPATWTTGPYIGNAGPLSAYGTWNAATSPAPAPPAPAPPAPAPPSPTDTTPPTVPGGLSVSGGTATSLTLSWTASSDNVGVTGYGRYKNGTLVSTTSGTSYTFTGLTCGTTYTLAVDATDAAGNRSTKAQTTAATTTCGDTQAPSTPTGLAVAAATPGSISISWAAAIDNVAVIGYGHYQNGSLVSTSSGTSYTFSGLTCGTGYTLAADATDAAGNRSTRAQITASTSPCATGPLVGDATVGPQADSSPAGEAEAAVTTAGASGQINELLVYLAPSNAAPTVKIGLYADAVGRPGALLASGTVASVKNGAWNVASIAPVPVTAGKQYWIAVLGIGGTIAYRDRCCGSGTPVQTAAGVLTTMPSVWTTGSYSGTDGPFSAYGDWTGSAQPPTPSPDTAPPSTPTGLLVSNAAQTTVTLSWTAASDNVAVASYGHYRNAGLVDSGTATNYTFSGLTCGTSYTLAVDASDAAGNRSPKAQVTVSTSACTSPPASANVYMSPSGSDTNPCTSPQPCRTFDRAYRVASPGAIVEVAGGSYPGQTINPDSSKTSTSDVVFRPAAGASVTVTGEIEANGAHFELRDMTINQINFPRSADDITLRNVINHGMWMQGPSNISIVGGEIACGTCNYHSHIQNASDGHPPTNILWDGVNFHDWQSQAGEHVECLQILGGDNVAIRNSTFKNCGTANGGLGATADLHLQAYNTPAPKNILLENNFFYRSGNPYVIQGEDLANFDMRNNSLAGPILLYDGPGPGTGIDITGNIMSASPCTAQNNGVAINWRYNVIQGATCGSTDKNAPAAGFIDPNNNLHLAAGSAALNAGDPTNFPAFDIDGQARPMGSAPDAGADESGTTPVGAPPGGAPPGADATPPSAPSSLSVSGATANSVSVNWALSTDNLGVTGYTVYNGSSAVGSTGGTTYTVTGLICATVYTIGVDAVDAAGNRSAKAQITAATNACPSSDTTPPLPVSGLHVSATTQTSISYAWNAATDNVGVAGYNMLKAGAKVDSTPNLTYTYSGLTCGTQYTFALQTYDAAGNTSDPALATATNSTNACSTSTDTTPPTTPTGLAATAASPNSISVGWTASTDNIGVTGYGRYQNGALISSGTGTTYTFTGLNCGTGYTLGVDAYDTALNRSIKAQITASTSACAGDTTPPSPVSGLHVSATSQTSISVAWNAATDNVGVAGYNMLKAGAKVASTPSLTYTYSGLTCGTQYTFAVQTYDAAGNTSDPALATATNSTSACTPINETTPPTTPTGLTATAASSNSISIAWTASTDNIGVTGYGRYQNGALISSGTGTTYTFTGLNCGTSYTLAVDAYDAAVNHSGKAQITASTTACTPPPPPPPPPSGSGSANLWLDTNGGSCTRQATAGAYIDSQACGSFQAAANAAQSGDTVNIVDGTYPGQEVSGTKTLTFSAAGPGRPSFGQFISAASNLTVRGILIENRSPQPAPFCSDWTLDYTLWSCGSNNTFDNVIVDGLHHASGDPERRGGIEVASGSGFVFKNGEVRGVWDSKGFQGGADNMLLENNYWHDIKLTPAGGAAGVHNECAYVTDGNNQVWRGNRFILCPVMAMFFANWLGGPAFTGVTVENNVFTHSLNDDGSWHDGSSFVIPNGAGGQNQVNNWVVRYNTFEVAPDIAQTPGTGDDNGSAKFYGNLGTDPDCGLPEWTISYNVGATCGKVGEVFVANATNTRGNPNQAPFYVNAPAGDFHLKAGLNLPVNFGAPTFPTKDLDGNVRPFGLSVDAGAYERQS